MRRGVSSVVAAVCAVVAGATPAFATPAFATPAFATPAFATPAFVAPAPSPVSSAVAVAPGTPVCTIRDNDTIELSGLVATDNGFVAMNDSTDVARRERVFFFDSACRVTNRVQYGGTGPNDPEDMALGLDGSIWVADIGDSPTEPRRPNVALWKFPPGGASRPVLYRLRYPDGAHDAEALLLGPDDTPIIVTKTVGAAGIYVPAAPLSQGVGANQTVALRKVGQFTPDRTGTSNPRGGLGYLMVTGGANSPDRTKVALRTYSDAYEWDAPDKDVVKAMTTTKPRITPLPDEPQGEAIAYTRDGSSFLTVSETADQPADVLPQILRYARLAAGPPAAGQDGTDGPVGSRNSLSWYDRLSLTQVTSLIAGVGVLGVLLVIAGVIGILRGRRRIREGRQETPVAAAAASARAITRGGGTVYGSGGQPPDRGMGSPDPPPGSPAPAGGYAPPPGGYDPPRYDGPPGPPGPPYDAGPPGYERGGYDQGYRPPRGRAGS